MQQIIFLYNKKFMVRRPSTARMAGVIQRVRRTTNANIQPKSLTDYGTMRQEHGANGLISTQQCRNRLSANHYPQHHQPATVSRPGLMTNTTNHTPQHHQPATSTKKSSVPLFWYRAFIIEYILTNRQIKEV